MCRLMLGEEEAALVLPALHDSAGDQPSGSKEPVLCPQ